MEDCTQHYDSIDLVKLVICFNKLKTPILLGRIIFLDILNPFYRTVNSRSQNRADLVILSRVSGIRSCDLNYALRKKLAPRLSNAHQTYSGYLIQCD